LRLKIDTTTEEPNRYQNGILIKLYYVFIFYICSILEITVYTLHCTLIFNYRIQFINVLFIIITSLENQNDINDNHNKNVSIPICIYCI